MGSLVDTLSAASGLSKADVQSEIDKVLAVRAAAEAAWVAGKRNMVWLEAFALSGSLHAMLEALNADDAGAYLKAAKEARDYAGRAHVHGSIWAKNSPAQRGAEG